MTRILFLPNPNTLIWLEVDRPARAVLKEIRAGMWRPPEPFHTLPAEHFTAACQDGVVTVTVTPELLDGPKEPARRLSQRQGEVLNRLAQGYTTRQIAHQLQVTPRMVGYHIAELKRIFQAQTRAELISKSSEFLGSAPQTPAPD